MAVRLAPHQPIVEVPATIQLGGAELPFTLRRSPRARGLRVTIHPARGIVVTVPVSTRRGWSRPDDRVEAFLREREGWVLRHVGRQERLVAEIGQRGRIEDGGSLRYRGTVHQLRIEPRSSGGGRRSGPGRRSGVERIGDREGDLLVVRLGTADRRPPVRVVRDWCGERARDAIEQSIARHAPALAVSPASVSLRDPRTRWGSASRDRRLSFSWRLVLAPPEALETVVIHELAHLRVFGHGPRFWELVASRRPDHRDWRGWLREHAFELHAALEA